MTPLRAGHFPPGTSAQRAELTALTRALEVSQGKRVNISTDSKYASLVLHAHTATWEERSYLTASGSPIKYHKEIDHLLLTIFQPAEVEVIHCNQGASKRNR